MRFRELNPSSPMDDFDISDSSSHSSLFDICLSDSLFGEKRMACVSVVFSEISESDIENIRKIFLAAFANGSVTLAINSPEPAPADFIFLAEEPAWYRNYPVLKGKELESAVSDIAKNKGFKLSPVLIKKIAIQCRGDLWWADMEIEKTAFISDKKESLEARPLSDLFSYIRNMRYGRDPLERLSAVESALSGIGDDPAKVFNILAASPPYKDSAENWFHKMADIDIAIRDGKMDFEEALDIIALSK